MTDITIREKFIGYIDILGFKCLVEAAENGYGKSPSDILNVMQSLSKDAPKLCPESKFIKKDLDFEVAQISDCVLVSSEISNAGIINLIGFCSQVIIGLLSKGLMCRGYITKGSIFHKGNDFFGSGFHKAYDKERKGVSAFKFKADEIGTPFVEIDSVVCDFICGCNDECVKNMFSRMVKSDGEVTSIFPFKKLSNSFIVAGGWSKFNPQKAKEQNEKMRASIQRYKKRIMEYVDGSNQEVMQKVKHYIDALDGQIVLCYKSDEIIDKMS